MTFIARQDPFDCQHCGAAVKPLERGSYRNHCPMCLWSKHEDEIGPGDRASECHGMMKPVGLDHDGKKGWMIVHVCDTCGKRNINKVAPDDNVTDVEGAIR